MDRYQTREGDTADYICWRVYGKQSGAVEQFLLANPNLSEYGEVYPAGLVVNLPEIATEPEAATVSLF